MSPKEKAKELVEMYGNLLINFPYIDTEDGRCIGNGYMTVNSAKQCAIICVDEIMKANPTSPLKGGYIELYSDMIDESIEYWQQVKTEINLL